MKYRKKLVESNLIILSIKYGNLYLFLGHLRKYLFSVDTLCILPLFFGILYNRSNPTDRMEGDGGFFLWCVHSQQVLVLVLF